MTLGTSEIIGFGLWISLGLLGFLKKLRNDRTNRIIIIFTGLIAIYPLTKIIEGAPYQGHLRQTDVLFLPFFYIITFELLRQLYKYIYRREPTYHRASWFDPEERRGQNWLDVFVYVGSFFISFVYIILIN